jgi:hypothetical protein
MSKPTPGLTPPSGALKELQRRMATAVMQPLTRKETMVQRRKDGIRMDQESAAFIKPNDRLSSFERLEIYNRQYWFRLYTSFEEDFPGVQAIVGRAKFEGLMRAYLTECPSTSFSLRNLGSLLPQWLPQHPEWTEPRTRLALDMAELEWAHIETFDEAEQPVLAPEDLAQVDGNSRLSLQPYLRLLTLHYPVDDLLIEVRNEAGSTDTSSNNASVARRTKVVRRVADLEPQQIFLALHRHQNSIYYKRLHLEDYRMLQALQGGESLETAIDIAFTDSLIAEADRTAFLQQAFQTWAALGWFAKTPLQPVRE